MTDFPLGCNKADIDTPALCIDLDAMESNIEKLVAGCRVYGVGWRPHAKCHKSAAIGRKLVAAGAIGLTCAKLGEAEVMAAAGIRDLLIANLIVGPAKVARLVALRRIADPIVCIDHLDQARPISAAMAASGQRLRVVIEVDIGMSRVGVSPGAAMLALAEQLARLPGLQLAGVMGYEGHLLTLKDRDEKRRRIQESIASLVEQRELLAGRGLPCEIVSCGGTGSFTDSVAQPGITEIQAGGAIFMDEFYRRVCHVSDFDSSLTVLATVVSRPTADRAIMDAGRKTLNMELHLPTVANRSGVHVVNLSAEHGILKLDTGVELRIGDRLELIPGYNDWTTVLHNQFLAFRGGRLEAIWPLEARGRLS